MEISAEGLFSSLQNEKKTGELVALPKDFYKKVEHYIKIDLQNGEDPKTANFKKLLANLRERRTQKLLIYLAYNKQLPTQIPEEEEELYNRIRKLLENTGNPEKIRKIKILSELPELMMPSGEKLGPYKQNQIIDITKTNEVEFLLNNKLGEII